ncbi:hypothetical protein Q8F55_006009 [Vanrija albida]|uniref:Uncharacterized protein n=1 Tax=Vanrija albida TaxID=181172 RepID=A0ABR3Q370_9TREE
MSSFDTKLTLRSVINHRVINNQLELFCSWHERAAGTLVPAYEVDDTDGIVKQYLDSTESPPVALPNGTGYS